MNFTQWSRSYGVRRSHLRFVKCARILARQIARSEHYIKARPLLNNGKAWR